MRNVCKVYENINNKLNKMFSERQILVVPSLVYGVIIFLCATYRIEVLDDPYFTDEIGYWAAGAWFSGHDWSSVMSKSAYYGWGYGLFLAPLFLINNSIKMFHTAVVLNAVFLWGTFFFNYRTLCVLFEKSKRTLLFIAFCSCMYTYNLVYAHTSMSEICLTFFFSMAVYTICLFFKKKTLLSGLLSSLVLMALVAVHLRCLIFVIAVIPVIIWMLIHERKDFKKILFFILGVAALLAMVFFVKEYIVNVLYTDAQTGTHIDFNDSISGKLTKLEGIFTPEWWESFRISLAGKIFYLSVSSFFILPFAIVGIVKYFWEMRKTYKSYLFLFLLLCALGNLAFIAYSSMNPGRVDQLLYGRYLENMVSVLLAIGLVYVFENGTELKYVFLVAVVCNYVFAQSIFNELMDDEKKYNRAIEAILPIQTSGIAGFPNVKLLNSEVSFSYYPLMIALVVGVCWFIILKKQKYVAAILVMVCWTLTAQTAVTNYIYNLNQTIDNVGNTRIKRFSRVMAVADYIELLGDLPYVYYLYEEGNDTSAYYDMFSLQYDLVDCELITLDNEELDSLEEGEILIVHKYNTMYSEVLETYNLLYDTAYFGVFIK